MYLYTHMAGEPNTASMPGLKAEKYELLFTQWHLEMKYKPTELCLYTNDRNPDLKGNVSWGPLGSSLMLSSDCSPTLLRLLPIVLRLFSDSPRLSSDYLSTLLRLSLASAEILPDCPQIVPRLCSDCSETARGETRQCCVMSVQVHRHVSVALQHWQYIYLKCTWSLWIKSDSVWVPTISITPLQLWQNICLIYILGR